MLVELLHVAIKQGSSYFKANWCFPLVMIHLISGHCKLTENNMPLVDLNKKICFVGMHSKYFNPTFIG